MVQAPAAYSENCCEALRTASATRNAALPAMNGFTFPKRPPSMAASSEPAIENTRVTESSSPTAPALCPLLAPMRSRNPQNAVTARKEDQQSNNRTPDVGGLCP